jgi:hypothetical protein
MKAEHRQPLDEAVAGDATECDELINVGRESPIAQIKVEVVRNVIERLSWEQSPRFLGDLQ